MSEIPYERLKKKLNQKDIPFDNMQSKLQKSISSAEAIRASYGGIGAGSVAPYPLNLEMKQKEMRAMMQEAPQAIGGEIGENIGRSVGGLPGALIGAGLGGMIGWNIQRDIQEKLGAEPMEFWPRLGKTFRVGGEEMFATEIGEGIGYLGRKIAKPFKGKLTKDAPRIINLAEKYGKYPTPGEVLDSWAADTFETISEASLFGGRRYKTHVLREIPEVAEKEAKSIIKKQRFGVLTPTNSANISKEFQRAIAVNLDPDQVADLMNKALYDKRWAANRLFNNAYKHLDGISKDVVVDLKGFNSFAKKQQRELIEYMSIGGTEAGDTLIERALKIGQQEALEAQEVDKIISGYLLPYVQSGQTKTVPQLTFPQARKLLTRLRKGEQSDISKQLTKILRQDMIRSAQSQNPRVANFFEYLQRQYQEQYAEKFNDQIIKGMVKTLQEKGEPEKIVRYAFVPGGISRVRKIKDVLGGQDSAAWRALKAKYVESLFKENPGVIMGRSIPKRLNDMGEMTVGEIFQPHERYLLDTIGKWANIRKGAKEMATGGGMLMQLTQGGAILAVLSGKFRQVGTPVVLIPEIVSQLSTRKQTSKWLVEGLSTPIGSPEAASLSIRILMSARRVQQDIQRERNLRGAEYRVPARPVGGRHF